MPRPPSGPGRRAARHSDIPVWLPPALVAVVVSALAGALWLSARLTPSAPVTDAALFLHLASLVVGFGAVLAVDWVALLWVVRRRHFSDVLHAADNVHIPVWVGYAGLLVTGVILHPDLANRTTVLKMGLVLVVGWNGALAMALHRGLVAAPSGEVPRRLLVWSALSAAVSQAGWWGATVIGFLNAR